MFMSVLWDTLFEIHDAHADTQVFLIGNYIPALRFGKADKPAVFAAGFGAEEWQSSVLLLRFFDKLMTADESGKSIAAVAARKAFEKRSVVVIPTVCPQKMREQGKPRAKDLQALARFLSFHASALFVGISGEEKALFSPASNQRAGAQGETVEKIISACAKLPIARESECAAAPLCRWASESLALPAFVLSPASLEAAALERTYRELEETLVVSALL